MLVLPQWSSFRSRNSNRRETRMTTDPFAQFKAAQRESWALFSPLATFTTVGAASLVDFAEVAKGEAGLDVACGTGVVASSGARRCARVGGMDLARVLLGDARRKAAVINTEIDL